MVLVNEILSQLSLVDKPTAWGTLATVKPFSNFDEENDAQTLFKALNTKGVDEATILNVLTNRTNEQRQSISRAFYRLSEGQDLEPLLKKGLSGHLETVIIALLKTPAAYSALQVNAAVKGLGTDEETLAELLCTRSNTEIQDMAVIYKQEFKKDLMDAIKGDTKGNFQKLLLALAKGNRDANSKIIDYELIEADVKTLRTAITHKPCDVDAWIQILTERSPNHLNRVFRQYKTLSGQDVTDSIKIAMKGDDETGFLTLVQTLQDTPQYFADRLHVTMKSMGTKDKDLIRILVSRCEIDLISVRSAFRKKYGKSLYSAIEGDTKGDYRSALLALCRAEDL
ncbi:annexin A2-like [Callorhinchus milii]|uniref:Annexin n=1 Tax=Callorhinchus milii TaxID=7868 RepID=V9L181_CALMI|nr:annexin A2-like [Callorhinchus milii]